MRIFVVKKNTLVRAAVLVVLVVAAVLVSQLAAVTQPVMAAGSLRPVTDLGTEQKTVAITIDTAFGDDYTAQILDVLKEQDVKATFFVMGAWANEYPERLAQIAGAGHEIAGHAYAHIRYTELTPDEIRADALATAALLREQTGAEMTLLRLPYGAYDDYVLETLAQNGITAVKWSVDSQDWKQGGVDAAVSNVLRYARNGGIVMFQSNVMDTPTAMSRAIQALREDGYTFTTVGAGLSAKLQTDTNAA